MQKLGLYASFMQDPSYSSREEALHSLSHGLGAVLGIAGLAVLVGFAAAAGEARRVVAAAIYGSSLILAFTASTMYHAIPSYFPRLKQTLRKVDHAMVFVLIAGTYTPICLVTLKGEWGTGLLLVVWVLAVLSITYETVFWGRYKLFSVILYLSLGWLVVVAVKPLTLSMPLGGLALLVAGGLVYTVGVGFYAARSLPFHHVVWHVLVLTGSILHFLAILLYVIRAR